MESFKRIVSVLVWTSLFGCLVVIFFNLTEWYVGAMVMCLFAALFGDKLTT